jgi:hypothetical protein
MTKERLFAIDGAATTDVDADASAVWEAVVDIDSSPQFISPIVSVERIGGSRKGDPLVAGTKWIEVRRYKKETVVMTKTITTVSSNDSAYPRTFSVNVDYGDGYNNIANTSTIAVSPAHISKDDGTSSTQLSGTFAAISGGLCMNICMLFCGRSIRKDARKSFRSELQEIGREAERRISMPN